MSRSRFAARLYFAVSALAFAAVSAPVVLLAPDASAQISRPGSPISSGPMLGYTTHREIAVWVQLDREASVRVDWQLLGPSARMEESLANYQGDSLLPANPTPEATGSSATHRTSAETFHTLTIPVTHLEPGMRYGYEIVVDGTAQLAAHEQVMTTETLWQWRTDPPTVRAALGSCLYVNDTAYDRPNNAYGGGFEILNAIASADPTYMLWLGDNVYLREVDWTSRAMMAYRYTHDRALDLLQPLLANVHHYAGWDDHDFGPNNSNRSFPFRAASLELFELFWANPTYGQPDLSGTFTQFAWGDVEVFVLDDRYHRTANDAPVEDRIMFGDQQIDWLLDALASSYAPFKLVVGGNQILNPNSAYEGLIHVPHEYERMLDGIAAREVSGVMFLSGDRHHAELIRIEREGLYPLYELTTSPLTAGAGDARHELENEARVEGTLVAGTRNFGILEVTGARNDRTLRMSVHDAAGDELFSHEVHESELDWPEE
ncbi:MAG: alkaline phosphatase D [Bradymonadia bacterium]|jgi:alkaline phosphatase D